MLGFPALMGWQRDVLAEGTALADGRPAYGQATVLVPRQQGKSTLLLPLMVAAALREPGTQVAYAAQTRLAGRRRMLDTWWPLLERSALAPLVSVRRQNGSEAFVFANGSAVSLVSGTTSAAHGETLDLAVIDEAWAQPDGRLEQAFRPAMLTRPGAQLWVVSTAGTAASTYLRGKLEDGRARAEVGATSVACYFEWSAPDGADASAPQTWRACMPALGITVTEDTVRENWELMDEDEFRRSHLNQWTAAAAQPWAVVPEAAWRALADPRAQVRDRHCLGAAVAPDRQSAAIAMAGPAGGGRVCVTIEAYLPGLDWVAGRLGQLAAAYRPPAVVADPGGPTGPLVPDIEANRVDLARPFGARDAAAAAGMFRDLAASGRLVHRGQPELDADVEAAVLRPLAGAHGWDTRGDAGLACLTAASLAIWGYQTRGNPKQPPYDILRSVA